ncbi:VCBS repeat-containing protein [Myxococcota bacterium]|nr:VCBS repeat-containing protein [Myxococcota bacterium]MBU1382202.1 VCBS repeat-containing protein [Myxococcota bacterium]MBU1499034.1 VCBS repeat-containing protein [Myxococcota bacterium]
MNRINIFLLLFITTACTGNDGKSSLQQLVSVSEADQLECPDGGYVLNTGLDTDNNGTLDASEILTETVVCNGSAGAEVLLMSTPEPNGVNCPEGGQRVDSGLDANKNGVLDNDEISNTTYVCNGENGAEGLLVITPEPSGDNCPGGGQRVDSGLDTNKNGILDNEEILNTGYVCNGISTLLTSSVEDPGDNCSQGGEKITSGQDTNANGILEESETATTLYICNGTDGTDTLTIATSEAPGDNCSNGGQKIDIGQDLDSDGSLSSTELLRTFYICNGLDGESKVCAQIRVGEDIILICDDGTQEAIHVGLQPSSGTFVNSGQTLTVDLDIALGDLDGDGDLDLYVARTGADLVYLNNGNGVFYDSGQSIGANSCTDVKLGDLDGDGDLDVFITQGWGSNEVWYNDGNGQFTFSSQIFPFSPSSSVALGDLDGDGDLDAFVSNAINVPEAVWFNDGTGFFVDSGQSLGSNFGSHVALADLDEDGDLDAMVAVDGKGYAVWINDGNGFFTAGDSLLTSISATKVALGDVDGDGDVDAVIAVNNGAQQGRLFLNDGAGNFTDSGHLLGVSGLNVTLADLDGDGDLDIIHSGTKILLNDGSGVFTDSGQILTNGVQAVGDLDSDGDLDLVLETRVWFND